jgi:hypothetical protein
VLALFLERRGSGGGSGDVAAAAAVASAELMQELLSWWNPIGVNDPPAQSAEQQAQDQSFLLLDQLADFAWKMARNHSRTQRTHQQNDQSNGRGNPAAVLPPATEDLRGLLVQRQRPLTLLVARRLLNTALSLYRDAAITVASSAAGGMCCSITEVTQLQARVLEDIAACF